MGLFRSRSVTAVDTRESTSSHNGRGFMGGRGAHTTASAERAAAKSPGGVAGLHRSQDKLKIAVAAERDADNALAKARTAVKAARAELELLEREAKAEARLAETKLKEAKVMRKATTHLGKR